MLSNCHRLSSYVKDKEPILIEADWAFAYLLTLGIPFFLFVISFSVVEHNGKK